MKFLSNEEKSIDYNEKEVEKGVYYHAARIRSGARLKWQE
jgi:hypothetical protein